MSKDYGSEATQTSTIHNARGIIDQESIHNIPRFMDCMMHNL